MESASQSPLFVVNLAEKLKEMAAQRPPRPRAPPESEKPPPRGRKYPPPHPGLLPMPLMSIDTGVPIVPFGRNLLPAV